MAFKKGEPRPVNAGRRPGSANRATTNAREAIARFVDDNAPRFQAWLTRIEKEKGPEAAWRCAMDLVEYHVPKLARTEVTGKDGGPVATVVNHNYGPKPNVEKQA